MATGSDLEERIQRVEEELAILKQRIATKADSEAWVDVVSGAMAGIAEFEQVVELGVEFRRSQHDPYSPPPSSK